MELCIGIVAMLNNAENGFLIFLLCIFQWDLHLTEREKGCGYLTITSCVNALRLHSLISGVFVPMYKDNFTKSIVPAGIQTFVCS